MLSFSSDSKPTKTPVQPAKAISRTSEGSSVTSIDTAALQIFSSGRKARHKRPQIVGARAEIVVDEDGVGLVLGLKFGDDLLHVAHEIRHVQPARREVAEFAAAVATARGDQAGGGQEALARQQIAARRRIVAIRPAIIAVIGLLQLAGGDVAEDLPPKLHSLAERQGVGVGRALRRDRR